MRDCESATAIRKPTTAPIRNPRTHSFAVKRLLCQRIWISHGPFTWAGWKSASTILCRCGIVTSLTGNGQVSSKRVPIQCQPSQSAQMTPRTSTKTPTRLPAFRIALDMIAVVKSAPCRFNPIAQSPSSSSCAS